LIAAIHAYLSDLRAKAGDGSLSLTDERTRLTRLQADKTQLSVEEATGLLVKKSEVVTEVLARELAIKSAFQQIPRSVAPTLVGKGMREIEAILTERLYAAMRTLAVR
jgi:phage terminase Nu1 subunit (DNA packaging protein)